LVIDAELAVPPETLCEVALELGDDHFEARGMVISAEEKQSPSDTAALHRMGIELIDPPPETKRKLASFLQREMVRRQQQAQPKPMAEPVRGNTKSKIYHRPDCRHYNSPSSEKAFASAQEAEAAGYRAAKDCSS
jgi:hypothetical protein